ncbi:potassium-transporting ATPase subunit KdpC [uncultured Desulfobulbus sp.]|uniref:potassium-transporting ATPase subunit KdpC n=1 Tax=uncultured Desulfobulbus sp. TaxID=239745 RepID=UPI0029C8AB51|nr:potassium-transporting ATPase subunit KdpC [uncultured Desulfobulbus sp.]
MKEIRPALLMLLLFSIVCGGIYPAVVTGLAQALFPHQAMGSFITGSAGKVVGSALIGQPFSDPKYLWPRPSATADFSYNPLASGGSNAGPTNPYYQKTVDERMQWLHAAGVGGPVAADLVQASGSGLDPHVTPQAAKSQIHRIALARGLSDEKVANIIAAHLEDRQFGFMGAPRVNVLAVNVELDTMIR